MFKFISLFSLTLVCGGAGAPVATSVQQQNTVVGSDASTPTITQQQYDDYIISVRDAIAAKMNSIPSISNKHEVWIRKIVGTYLANVQNYDPTAADELQKAGLTPAPLTPQQILQKRYDYAHQQANSLGISVIDYDDFMQNSYDKMCQGYADNDKDSPSYDQDVETYKATLSQAIQISKAGRYDNFGFATTMAALYAKQGYSAKDPNDPAQDFALHAAFAQCRNLIGSLKQKEDTSDFTSLVNGYSAVGHYGVGDEIQPQDFAKIYDYTYDIAGYGVNYEDYIPADIDSWKATKPGDYDQDILKNLYVTKEFNGCTDEDAPVGYEAGELIPGIMLHEQIMSMDTNTDSHTCKMQIKYGISHTGDSTKILWYDTDAAASLTKKAELTKADELTFHISANDQLGYMGQHTYYASQAPYEISVTKNNVADGTADTNTFSYRDDFPLSDGTTKATVFGLEDWKERPYLDEMLDKYGQTGSSDNSDEYDFAKNPIYITQGSTYFGENPQQAKQLTEDYYGIPLPNNIDDFNLTQINHEHQQLALKISDINTNDDLLMISWCYIDAIKDQQPSIDNNRIKNAQDYLDVCDIPWQVNGVNFNTINLYYHINPSTKGYIDFGLTMGAAIDSYTDTADKFVNDVKTMKTDKIKVYVDLNNGFDEATQVFSIASAALSAINAVQAAINACIPGASAAAVWATIKAVAGALVALLSMTTFVMQSVQAKKDDDMLNQVHNYLNTYSKQDLDAWTEVKWQTSDDYKLLQDSHGTYAAKKRASANISKAFITYFSTDEHKSILINELKCNFNKHKVDAPDYPVEADPDMYASYFYDELMEPIGTDSSQQLTDDEIVKLVQKGMVMNDLDSNLTDETTEYVTAISNREQSYLDSGWTKWADQDGKPMVNIKMLTSWADTKRFCSNSKNMLYFVRDMANLLSKAVQGKWEDNWDYSDLFSNIIAKFCPIPGLRTVGNYFSRFQDIFKKFVTWTQSAAKLERTQQAFQAGEASQIPIGDYPAVALARVWLAVLSTGIYLIQSILTSAWIPTNN